MVGKGLERSGQQVRRWGRTGLAGGGVGLPGKGGRRGTGADGGRGASLGDGAGSWREEGGRGRRGASLGGGAGSWREDKGLFGETGLQARGQGGRPGTGCCYWGRGRSVGEYRGHLLVDWTGNTVRQ
ncbi:protein FAM98B-like [Mya arenaria]|uniref:protein FAM98B-like n=1 Tax=Mya arenaria TaxID=6604 RepID=UPI0022E061BF|nr:protein FAM98B-like [Mya arenaria]